MKLLVAIVLAVAALAGGCATRPVRQAEPIEPLPSPRPPLRPALPTPVPPLQEAVPAPAPLTQNETQVGRYSTVTAAPAEADANPLAVIAKVHFPRGVVNTVGEAVRYVLIRTGYKLVSDDDLDARVKAVFALRLPDNQRVLGPYRVDAILGVLMGQPYQLVADPAARTVTYIAPPARDAPPVAPTSLRLGTPGLPPAHPAAAVAVLSARVR